MKAPSPQAIELISSLSAMGHAPRQIKELMEDSSYLRVNSIPEALSSEIHTFMCKNWEAIVFYCRSSK